MPIKRETDRRKGAPIGADEHKRLVRFVANVGEREAAERLDVTRTTLARALAKLAVSEGTAARLREKLAGVGGAVEAAS